VQALTAVCLSRLYINSLLDVSNARNHQGFLYIKCQLLSSTRQDGGQGIQLLPLPPKLRRLDSAQQRGSQHTSINIILTGDKE
jgi:hypothetical protein